MYIYTYFLGGVEAHLGRRQGPRAQPAEAERY